MLKSYEMNRDDNLSYPLSLSLDTDTVTIHSLTDGIPLCKCIEKSIDLAKNICKSYQKDTTLAKVLSVPDTHTNFGIKNKLIWMKNQYKQDVVYIPHELFLKGRRLLQVIMD